MANLTDITNATASWLGADLYNFAFGSSSVTDPSVATTSAQGATFLGRIWSQTPTLNEIGVVGQNAIRDYGIQVVAYPAAFLGGSYLCSFPINVARDKTVKREEIVKVAIGALLTYASLTYGSSSDKETLYLLMTALTGGLGNAVASLVKDPAPRRKTQDKIEAKATEQVTTENELKTEESEEKEPVIEEAAPGVCPQPTEPDASPTC